MNKPNQQTAIKMLQLVDLSTYQGRITYLAIAFLSQTGATFAEVARLTVSDVYAFGRPKKWVRIKADTALSCTMLVGPTAQKTVKLALEVQSQHGLVPYPAAPLFRTPSGKAFTAKQLASIFAMYRQAAKG
jgi:hypothetical protein